jgi:N-acetylmuramic acid 6-phosphate etherase
MILGIDLGKTSCRAVVGDRRAEGPGAPGLAAPGGVRAAQAAILALTNQLANQFGSVEELVVGAAGALSAPAAARALGEALLGSLRA